MLIVINIIDGELGVVYQCNTWENAVDRAVQTVLRQINADYNKSIEDQIRQELNENYCYEVNGFVVHIAQTEN